MESSKQLQQLEYQIKVIADFIARGNYSNILGIQPHAVSLDGWSANLREIAAQLTKVAAIVDSEISEARSNPLDL
ncbi:MAG: hypothetical protein KME16_23600 [Scytolyngbya sp. HA4215-MV1]|jgi:hypothetical protein|nr:hypothetical protein [Scytolyngbya sp. HA4215-MV1]